ncbi:MAG TPA: G1 family glutamic endopeptidase [Bryobacteraceae bacterium]|nr:G1 family glutamic endopeptidase [Bryobacteraceae bacterium]
MQSWESSNWSGYAVTGANGSVTSVTNSWIVPVVNCSIAPEGYSSFWVGIDGFSSSTVEQIGTDSDCVSLNGTETGIPTYYAWFEFYPQNAYLVEFPRAVQPGDVITASVKASGNGGGRLGGHRFTVTLTDVTRDETFSTTSSVSGAKQSSAEWIAETPCCESSGSVLPLADFGTVNYGADFTSAANTAYATVGNTTAPIGKFGANVQEITMVTDTTPSATMAQPSGLSKDGTSFSVAWANAGP